MYVIRNEATRACSGGHESKTGRPDDGRRCRAKAKKRADRTQVQAERTSRVESSRVEPAVVKETGSMQESDARFGVPPVVRGGGRRPKSQVDGEERQSGRDHTIMKRPRLGQDARVLGMGEELAVDCRSVDWPAGGTHESQLCSTMSAGLGLCVRGGGGGQSERAKRVSRSEDGRFGLGVRSCKMARW